MYVHIFVHAHVFTVFPGCCGDKYADSAVGLADEYDSINPNTWRPVSPINDHLNCHLNLDMAIMR